MRKWYSVELNEEDAIEKSLFMQRMNGATNSINKEVIIC